MIRCAMHLEKLNSGYRSAYSLYGILFPLIGAHFTALCALHSRTPSTAFSAHNIRPLRACERIMVFEGHKVPCPAGFFSPAVFPAGRAPANPLAVYVSIKRLCCASPTKRHKQSPPNRLYVNAYCGERMQQTSAMYLPSPLAWYVAGLPVTLPPGIRKNYCVRSLQCCKRLVVRLLINVMCARTPRLFDC